jgi:hypothetical protein
MEEHGTMIMASRANARADLRNVPLGLINDCIAKTALDAARPHADASASLDVALFNSSI